MVGRTIIIQVKFKRLHPDAVLPKYAKPGDAGMDLCAVEDVVLMPNVPTLVKTGWAIEIPPGYEGQVRSRSGLALKHGVRVVNSPGTLDSSYRGEIGVILEWGGRANNAIEIRHVSGSTRRVIDIGPGELVELQAREIFEEVYRVRKGDRIAQLVIARFATADPVEAEELSETERGEQGFGSSGR